MRPTRARRGFGVLSFSVFSPSTLFKALSISEALPVFYADKQSLFLRQHNPSMLQSEIKVRTKCRSCRSHLKHNITSLWLVSFASVPSPSGSSSSAEPAGLQQQSVLHHLVHTFLPSALPAEQPPQRHATAQPLAQRPPGQPLQLPRYSSQTPDKHIQTHRLYILKCACLISLYYTDFSLLNHFSS